MSQLIITLDDDLLQDAQAYARQHGQALDALLADFLQATVRPAIAARPLSPRIQKLLGAIELPPDFDYKESIAQAIAERYGL